MKKYKNFFILDTTFIYYFFLRPPILSDLFYHHFFITYHKCSFIFIYFYFKKLNPIDAVTNVEDTAIDALHFH
jgi:hypothetical protein